MPKTRRHPRKPKHDASYKRIFAHKRTMADLLRGFVGDLARHLDFPTLERLPASFVTEHLGQRHADLLWKMQTAERRWVYLLVLLEFQSTVDSRMALRMLDYTPVPREFVGYLPRHRYLLIDLKALDPAVLPVENVVSLVAMLEQADSQARLEDLGASLADWLRRVGETEVLDSFEAWVTQVVERTGPQGTLDLDFTTEEDGGMSSSLAERVRKWGDELNQQWLEKGIEQERRAALERERALVLRLVVRRFGSETADRLTPMVATLSDPERITAMAEAVIECETPEEFLARAARA